MSEVSSDFITDRTVFTSSMRVSDATSVILHSSKLRLTKDERYKKKRILKGILEHLHDMIFDGVHRHISKAGFRFNTYDCGIVYFIIADILIVLSIFIWITHV